MAYQRVLNVNLKLTADSEAFASDQKYKQAAYWICLPKGLESHYILGPTYICKKNNPRARSSRLFFKKCAF